MATFKGSKNRDDSFVGTAKDDRFVFDPADLTGGDLILGGDGKGTDVLAFTAAGAITEGALANVIGIERIELSDLGNTITLREGLIDTARGHELIVQGGAGDDRINAAAVRDQDDEDGLFQLLGGTGDDVLIGGDDDRFLLDGGVGRDTIVVAEGRAVYDPKDARVTATDEDATLLIDRGMTLDLTRSGDLTDGDRAIVTGFRNVDASASRQSVTLVGAQWSVLTGGSAADTIIGGAVIRGGGGRDTLIGGDDEGYHTFVIAAGDFVAGETITGRSSFDFLEVTGSADFRKGDLEGIEQAMILAPASGKATVSFFTSQVGMVSTAYGPGEHVAINLYLDGGTTYSNRSIYSYDVALHATEGNDTIDVAIMKVLAGAGNDIVTGSGAISGGAGDDHVTFTNSFSADVLVDGGKGIDTLAFLFGGGSFDLSKAGNQALFGSLTVRGFENLDLGSSGSAVSVIGSRAANHIIGGTAADTLDGGAGNDILQGGGGYDVLTGGAGKDVFVWTERADDVDTVLDFHTREDRLQFDAEAFHVAGGVVDTRVVSEASPADLRGVDLFVYTGGALDTVGDVNALLSWTKSNADEGIFVAGTNSQGETVLFMSGPTTHGGAVVDFIATLGRDTAAIDLHVGDFILA